MTRVPSAGMFFRRLHSLPSYSIYFGGLPVGLLFFVFFFPPILSIFKGGRNLHPNTTATTWKIPIHNCKVPPSHPTHHDRRRCRHIGRLSPMFPVWFGGDVHFSAISRSHLRLEVQEAFFFFVFVDLLSAFLRIPGVPDPACY